MVTSSFFSDPESAGAKGLASASSAEWDSMWDSLVSVLDSESVAGAWVDGASAESLSRQKDSSVIEVDLRDLLLFSLSLLGLFGSVLLVST